MDYPIRKPTRLKDYNYSLNGAYFLTLCVKDRMELLCRIVGDGAPDVPQYIPEVPSKVMLSEYGNVIEEYIISCSEVENYPIIDKYVIMPNHVHLIVLVENDIFGGGSSRAPTPTNAVIPSFVSSLKRFVNKKVGFQLWQRSYHDHIIRNERDYCEIWQYIDENPWKWEKDCFYIK